MLTRLALAAVLVVAAALRLWRLDQNGFGNEYYTAGVRSMATGWHNFLYHAFDPAGFISVDKPPLAMWIQTASVKLFGFHGLSVLVPQVLEGLAAVLILYWLVRRGFGVPAGLLAAAFLAVTPVSVAVDRSSNTESCLILTLLLAAWALLRAAETGSRAFLLLSMALVGLAFNVKMLAAFVALPAFAAVYLLGTPLAWRRRLVDGTLAAMVLVAISASWALVYDLTPRASRPYAGTTDTNSIAELIVGPYGMGRFVRQVRGSVAAAGETRAAVTATTRPGPTADRPPETGPRTGAARLFVRVPAGPLRLADGQLAGQVGWLLPFAIMGAALGARGWRPPLAPANLSLVLWVGWAVLYGAVYSAAGGFFHFYYLALLAPPLAALAGIGVVSLWRSFGGGGWRAALLPVTLLLTAVWQLYVDASAVGSWRDLLGELSTADPASAWRRWLHGVLVGGTLAAAVVLAAVALRPVRGLAAAAVAVGLVASLAVPGAWALSSVLVPGHGVLPSADVARLLADDVDGRGARRFIDPTSLATLIGFLRANHGGERYLLATSTTTLAAPIIIATGEPVMARGGFHGLDPILTPEKLAALVEANQVRFVMLGDLTLVSRRMGAELAGRPIADWVRANGKRVDPALWRGTRRGMSLYDLRPDRGLVPAPAPSPTS